MTIISSIILMIITIRQAVPRAGRAVRVVRAAPVVRVAAAAVQIDNLVCLDIGSKIWYNP